VCKKKCQGWKVLQEIDRTKSNQSLDSDAMKKCIFCNKFIWFWQRIGWIGPDNSLFIPKEPIHWECFAKSVKDKDITFPNPKIN